MIAQTPWVDVFNRFHLIILQSILKRLSLLSLFLRHIFRGLCSVIVQFWPEVADLSQASLEPGGQNN